MSGWEQIGENNSHVLSDSDPFPFSNLNSCIPSPCLRRYCFPRPNLAPLMKTPFVLQMQLRKAIVMNGSNPRTEQHTPHVFQKDCFLVKRSVFIVNSFLQYMRQSLPLNTGSLMSSQNDESDLENQAMAIGYLRVLKPHVTLVVSSKQIAASSLSAVLSGARQFIL